MRAHPEAPRRPATRPPGLVTVLTAAAVAAVSCAPTEPDTIVVSGASGQLGGLVVEELLARGVAPERLILVSRTPEALERYAAMGASTRFGDFTQPESLVDAYAGGDRMLLISIDTGVGAERAGLHENAIDAAVAAGVRHVAYTSFVDLDANDSPLAADHVRTEQALRESGLAWTMLRNSLYMNGVVARAARMLDEGRVVGSDAGGVAYVTREDCAAAAAAVLATEGHEFQAYDVTGPAVVFPQDIARAASEVTGRPIEVVEAERDGAQGASPAGAASLAVVSSAVEDLTGRPPMSVRDLLEARRADLGVATVAIDNVTVIDAARGVRAGRTVILRGDTIVAVDPAGAQPDVDEVLDGSGRFLIPGLWDMHVHLTYDDALVSSMSGLLLRWGVTSVRDTGGLLGDVLPVVEAMRAEDALAPRVFFAGPLLDGGKVVYDGVGRPEIGISNPTPDAARANVTALAEAGVDFIKIYELVTPGVFEALVAAAGEHGLPIDAHVPLSMRAREVAPRVHSMEHVRNVELDCAAEAGEFLAARRAILSEDGEEPGGDLRSRLHALQRLRAIAAYDPAVCEEALAAMAGTIQVPTLRLNSFTLRPPFARDDWFRAIEAAPPQVATSWRAEGESWRADPPEQDTTFAAWSLRLVGLMHERGIPVGAGTDTPISYALPGYALHSELEMLVRAGLSTLEALRAATIRPAEFFGLEGEMGSIEPGMRADLVLLSADPVADISNTRLIEAVVTRGRVLAGAQLEALTR